ncbi:uncharacterized protein [Mytilus edulis]|uniref:uncharacterized protein n=1 Tax=Mytilus edulis TaxID=6550 RepID=UPI0039EF9163
MENGRNIMTLDSDTNISPKGGCVSQIDNCDSKMEEDIVGVNGKKRKLVVHFDLRNTVLVSDSVTNVTMEQALNSFLTGVVWGRDLENGAWRWHSYIPSLTPPAEGTTTFYKYLERKLVKTPKDRTLLRIATGDFAHSDIGKGFLPYFDSHIDKMKWKHSEVPQSGKLTMSGSDGKHYHYILPSVYKAIHQLHEDDRDFAIVFRTYGLDTANVISSVKFGLAGNHPGFPEDLQLPVNQLVGKVKRGDNQSIEFMTYMDDSTVKEFKNDRDIYNMLSKSQGISGYMDDFQYWQDNGYMYSTAKPLYIDPFDTSVQHIFFDDNFRKYENDSIVDVRLFDSAGGRNAKSVLRPEIEKFENLCVVQADLMTAIDDGDYFLKCIRNCEEKYTQYLKKLHGIV